MALSRGTGTFIRAKWLNGRPNTRNTVDFLVITKRASKDTDVGSGSEPIRNYDTAV